VPSTDGRFSLYTKGGSKCDAGGIKRLRLFNFVAFTGMKFWVHPLWKKPNHYCVNKSMLKNLTV